MLQGGASGPARLWQLRSILALDLAVHVAADCLVGHFDARRRAVPAAQLRRQSRAQDPVRQRSEESYRRARIRLS